MRTEGDGSRVVESHPIRLLASTPNKDAHLDELEPRAAVRVAARRAVPLGRAGRLARQLLSVLHDSRHLAQALLGLGLGLLHVGAVALGHHGLENEQRLREQTRAYLSSLSEDSAEEQKANACLDALAERLCQSVPAAQVSQVKDALFQDIAQQIATTGQPVEAVLAQMGMRPDQLDSIRGRLQQQLPSV